MLFIVTRKGAMPSVYPSLGEATREAVKITEPPCWIWRLEVTRRGTLKRFEVAWEDIKSIQVEGISCIQNRSQQDTAPVDGQLYFAQDDGQVKISEYRRGLSGSQASQQPTRFVREVKEPVQVTSPAAAGQYFLEHVYTPWKACMHQEEMWVLLLNRRHKITHQVMVYRGTVDKILVRIAELFGEAIRLNAPALIIAHNHPSGDPEPSGDDLHHARRVQEAAKLLAIDLLDVMIVGDNSWVSLKQRRVI